MRVAAFAEPFRHWLVEDCVDADLARAAAAAVPAAVHPAWVRYWSDVESRKWAMNDPDGLGPAWRALFAALTAPGWLARWSEAVGAELRADPLCWGGGLHVTFGGGTLSPHLDYALHPSGLERRLNLVLYLSDGNGWGGQTTLCDPDGRVVKSVEPRFNRALFWEASDLSYHGTARLAADAPPRVTAAVYYLAEPRPGTTRRRAVFLPVRG